MKSTKGSRSPALRSRIGTSAVLMAAFLLLPGCADVDIHAPDWAWDGDWDGEFSEVRNTNFAAQEDFRYEASAPDTLSLTGIAGIVEITGSPTAESVVVEGVRRVRSESVADAEEHLSALRVDTWESDQTLWIKTRQPSQNRGRRYEVEYRITVPTGTAVRIHQVSGPVEVRSASGHVDVQSVAGNVTFEGPAANLRATVLAGEIRATADVLAGGVIELTANTGDIHLSVPKATSASLLASTVTGEVRLRDLSLDDQDPRASVLRATMAAGDGTIRLETVVGDITVTGR